MKLYLRVCAEINLDAVAYNFKNMKKNLTQGTRIVAVVKTDGYGHGAVPIARMVQEYDYIWGFAVATLEEALLLRRAGIQKPILVLGYVFPDGYEDMVKYEIRPTIFKLGMAEQFSKEAVRQNKIVYFHIKVDTGMSRIGFMDDEESANIVEQISHLSNVKMEGLFTHFARADERDKTAAKQQLDRYLAFLELLRQRGVEIELSHCSNSAGIFDMQEANLDMVRAGISIYGMYPSEEVNHFAVPMIPVMSLKSHIVFIKQVEPGTEISYGGTFVAQKPMRIATIPVGYGDGYPRSLSNKGWVLIHGKQALIVGRVCMDQFMVDVTDIPEAKEGDMVILIGSEGGKEITIEDMAKISGRFHYEISCDIGKRVPRRFWRNGKIVATQDYFDQDGIKLE